jgi:hypothetical protein
MTLFISFPILVLRSLNPVTKDTPIMTMILGRASPDPRLSSPVELSRPDTRRLLDFRGGGETLSSQGIAAEQAPPAFLQIQPACSCRDKDVMEARMLGHPGAGLSAIMAAEIICDNEDVAAGIVGFDVLEERDVVGRVTRGGTPGQFLTITHTQRSIHPGFFGATTVIQRCFDTVPIS